MSRTIIMSLRVMNGFRLNDDFVPETIDDDMYEFTFVEGQPGPSHDEVKGDKNLIISLLKQFTARLESPDWQEVKYEYGENTSDAEKVIGKQNQQE